MTLGVKTWTSWSVKETGGAVEAHIRWERVAGTRTTEDSVGGPHGVLAVVVHQGVQAMEHWGLSQYHWHESKVNMNLWHNFNDHICSVHVCITELIAVVLSVQPLPAHLERRTHPLCTSESGCVLDARQLWRTTQSSLQMKSSPWWGRSLLHHPLQ